jgi:hypothetical protein
MLFGNMIMRQRGGHRFYIFSSKGMSRFSILVIYFIIWQEEAYCFYTDGVIERCIQRRSVSAWEP